MSLNCKQGDLAFIVSARNPENVGKIVTVAVALGPKARGDEFIYDGQQYVIETTGFYWIIEGSLTVRHFDDFGTPTKTASSSRAIAMDASLRPIRDSKGDDETLEWAPVPGKVKTE